MRNPLCLIVFQVGMLVAFSVSDVVAQSGSRGSGTRMAPRASYGVPSRIGGARSKTVVPNTPPTGMMNSANAARMSNMRRAAGSSSRPSTGMTSRRSFAPSTSGFSGSRSYGSGVSGSRPTTGLLGPQVQTSRPARRSSASSPSVYASTTVPRPDGLRRWTDASGKYSIQGNLAAEQNGVVWIRRLDGKLARLSVRQLSEQDQQFLASR